MIENQFGKYKNFKSLFGRVQHINRKVHNAFLIYEFPLINFYPSLRLYCFRSIQFSFQSFSSIIDSSKTLQLVIELVIRFFWASNLLWFSWIFRNGSSIRFNKQFQAMERIGITWVPQQIRDQIHWIARSRILH